MNIARCLAAFLVAMALFDLSQAQHYPPTFSQSVSYAVGDQVQLNGNVLRATHAVTPGTFKYDEWELWEVRSNTTVMIGVSQTFPTLPAAWNYVHNARIADGAYLHLYISTVHGLYNETLSAPFSLDQSSGSAISLLGDTESNVNLSFTSTKGFVIDSGHSFASVSNLTLNGANTGEGGFYASGGASISNIAGCSISGFSSEIYADTNASISVGPGMAYASYIKAALTADNAGTITAPNVAITSSSSQVGVGLWALRNGVINAYGASLANLFRGASAEQGGLIFMESSRVSGCSIGCYADMPAGLSWSSATLG